ncbi:MAG: M15 family metallopeptidase [Spirochaetota bacterium]|nr:M15 family metallopeptidase [Spirochaetota bacterium]
MIKYIIYLILLTNQISFVQAQEKNIIDSKSSLELIENNSIQIIDVTNTNIVAVNINTDTNTNINTNVFDTEEKKEESFIEDGNFSVSNVFRSLLSVYPNIVQKVSDLENPYYPDLAINVRGTNFYNVNGRFLPEEERKNWKYFSSNTVYFYPKEIPNPKTRTKAEIALIKKQSSKHYRRIRKPTYYGFNQALYGMSRLSDTNTQIMKGYFLGKQILIHQFAYEALKQVEIEIYALTNDDLYKKEVKKFLKEGTIVYSFFWRTIAGSKSRSLHSYGVAIDVLEENSIKAIYWLWRQNLKIDWVREPISVRWNPPNSVVQIFEKYGFIWGGKWNFYDTMHFEYKPEILLLNGYDVILLSQQRIPVLIEKLSDQIEEENTNI